jgi:hypothetical protein
MGGGGFSNSTSEGRQDLGPAVIVIVIIIVVVINNPDGFSAVLSTMMIHTPTHGSLFNDTPAKGLSVHPSHEWQLRRKV